MPKSNPRQPWIRNQIGNPSWTPVSPSMKQFFALVFFSLIGICFLRAESQPTNKDVDPNACSRIILNGGWKLRTSSGLSDSGEKISSPDYTLNTSWIPAVVPGTVLTSYVKAGLYPDPYVGLNNKKITSPISKNHNK